MRTRPMYKLLILLRGLPGAGKSSFASWMFSNNVFEADQYFINKETGEYEFSLAKLPAAHAWCQNEVEELMKQSETPPNYYGQEIVVSNTSTTEAEMQPYYDLAEKYGYRVVSLIVENRHGGKSVHNVPEETLERMKKRFSVKL